MSHEIRPGEIVIEIDVEHVTEDRKMVADPGEPFNPEKWHEEINHVIAGNSRAYFQPINDTLRGRLTLDRWQAKWYRLDRATYSLPDEHPGQRIHLDPILRIGRITDGIADPANAEMMKKFRHSGMNMEQAFPFIFLAVQDRTIKLATDQSFYTWAFWMRRFVEQGCATSGERFCRPLQNLEALPSMDECLQSRSVLVAWNGEDPRVMESARIQRERREEGFKEAGSPTNILTPELMNAR